MQIVKPLNTLTQGRMRRKMSPCDNFPTNTETTSGFAPCESAKNRPFVFAGRTFRQLTFPHVGFHFASSREGFLSLFCCSSNRYTFVRCLGRNCGRFSCCWSEAHARVPSKTYLLISLHYCSPPLVIHTHTPGWFVVEWKTWTPGTNGGAPPRRVIAKVFRRKSNASSPYANEHKY